MKQVSVVLAPKTEEVVAYGKPEGLLLRNGAPWHETRSRQHICV